MYCRDSECLGNIAVVQTLINWNSLPEARCQGAKNVPGSMLRALQRDKVVHSCRVIGTLPSLDFSAQLALRLHDQATLCYRSAAQPRVSTDGRDRASKRASYIEREGCLAHIHTSVVGCLPIMFLCTLRLEVDDHLATGAAS